MASSQAHDIAALKSAVYDASLPLVAADPRLYFNQASILELGVIPNNDLHVLLQVMQGLVDDKLFKILHSEGLAWRLRTVDEARKYRNLKPEHEIVYSLIDEAGDEGIWSKTIKTRTNLHDAVFRSAIKFLESKALISDMKSVEHPNRKMYIKASVQPSERATGGPWFTDGELDEEFIATISRLLYVFVKRRSWYRSKGRGTERSAKKRVGKVSVEEIRARRDGALGARDVDVKMQDRDRDRNDDSKKPSRQTSDSLLPLPANYAEYPTLHELTALVDESAISKDTTLSAEEIQQLLDLLVYDGKIERLNVGPDGVAYKASRSSFLEEENEGEGMGSVLMEAPCGRCPVFDLCEEGGPVGPSNCEYFNEWLEM